MAMLNLSAEIILLVMAVALAVVGIKRNGIASGHANVQPWIEFVVGLLLCAGVFYFSLRAFQGRALLTTAVIISLIAAAFSSIGALARYKKLLTDENCPQESKEKLLTLQRINCLLQFFFYVASIIIARQFLLAQ